jgi:hypothetical protein
MHRRTIFLSELFFPAFMLLGSLNQKNKNTQEWDYLIYSKTGSL